VRCGRKALIEHHVGVFRACLAHLQDIDCTKLPAFDCFIVHKDAFAAHCGLGSTSGAAFGVLHGLNECFARPFTGDQIRRILACNYVEECRTSPGYLVYGYETTMTATGANGGGCYVIDENSLDILARNCSVFESLPVLLFAPSKASVDSSEVCEDAVLAEGAVNDTAEDEKTKKEHQFNSIIIPELKKGNDCDITVIGCAVYSLQCSGGKQVEVEKQKEGRLIYGFMDAVKAHPCTQIVGMSSMGPTISVVCKAGTDAHALDTWRLSMAWTSRLPLQSILPAYVCGKSPFLP